MGLDKKSVIVRNVVRSVIIIVNRTKYFVNFNDAMLLFILISPLTFYNKNITLNLSNNNKNYRFSIKIFTFYVLISVYGIKYLRNIFYLQRRMCYA